MKQFFALCVFLGMAVTFVGCDKKAEVKTQTTVTDPAGTTTTTDSKKVETDK